MVLKGLLVLEVCLGHLRGLRLHCRVCASDSPSVPIPTLGDHVAPVFQILLVTGLVLAAALN